MPRRPSQAAIASPRALPASATSSADAAVRVASCWRGPQLAAADAGTASSAVATTISRGRLMCVFKPTRAFGVARLSPEAHVLRGRHVQRAGGCAREVERDPVAVGAAVDHGEDRDAAVRVHGHARAAWEGSVRDPARALAEDLPAGGPVAPQPGAV